MEADLSRQGEDLRHLFQPRGGPSRLTLRRLAVLFRHLPPESHTAKALGGDGFSMLELLTMEAGIAGPLNPRHPWEDAERAKKSSRVRMLKERQAYYAAKSDGLARVGQDHQHQGQTQGSEGEREQEAEHPGVPAAPVEGADDDADDVDGDGDEQERVHEATVTLKGGA